MVAVVALTTGVAALADWGSGDDFTVQSPMPEHNVSYNESQERLRITVAAGGYAAPDADQTTTRVYLVRRYESASGPKHAPVTVAGGGEVLENGLWYDEGNRSVATAVPSAGDSATIVDDGTDQDDDGIAGVEPGEVYRVGMKFSGGVNTLTFEVSVRDGQVCTDAESTCDPRP